MIPRRLESVVVDRLEQFPAVVLLGPRQVGKTTLAQLLSRTRPSIYLDLEDPADRAKLDDPRLYLSSHEDELVILDEVHRVPELFGVLRGVIDRGRMKGRRSGRFLLLGSASMDLLRQSGESLAGRIAYVELPPLGPLETESVALEQLWQRGGFPDSYCAPDDSASFVWRENFIRTYLERDIPDLGPRVPAETIRRLWTMLAHGQCGLLNAAQLARGLAVDGKTVARYLDLLVDLLLVRRLEPFHANVGKRLVKSPKILVRDSGIVHALLRITNHDTLLGHPVVGSSWEGFVTENLISAAPDGTTARFFRTAAGAEIDLVLEVPDGEVWAIEIKRGLTPTLERGFHLAREDLKPARSFVVYSGSERYPMRAGIEAVSVTSLATELASRGTG